MARFVKGQSGNPSGRPRAEHDVRELAKKHAPEAVTTLVGVMQSKSATPSSKVSAAIALLDRAFGRPAQTVHNIDGNAPKIDERLLFDLGELLAKKEKPGSPPPASRGENRQETEAAPVVADVAESEAPPGLTH